MPPRFHAAVLDVGSGRAVLSADEARHLSRVLRLGPGAEVAVFDGRGREFLARIVRVDGAGAEATLIAPRRPAPESPLAITVAQALLKGDKMDDVVRDATMLGAGTFVALRSQHVAVRGRSLDGSRLAERWRRVALASAKQCGRAVLPEIVGPVSLEDWLATGSGGVRLLLVEPSAEQNGVQPQPVRSLLRMPRPESVALIVGPEGGWAPDELDGARRAGCALVSLGELTLRADAVAVAALAVLRTLWAE